MSATKSQMFALLQKAVWRLHANNCYHSDSARALLSDIENLIGNQDSQVVAGVPVTQMRQKFEEWCLSALPHTARELRKDGRYFDPTIEMLWQSWQASRARRTASEYGNDEIRWPDGLQNY